MFDGAVELESRKVKFVVDLIPVDNNEIVRHLLKIKPVDMVPGRRLPNLIETRNPTTRTATVDDKTTEIAMRTKKLCGRFGIGYFVAGAAVPKEAVGEGACAGCDRATATKVPRVG